MNIYLIKNYKNKRIEYLIQKYNLHHDESSSIALIINSNSLELYDRFEPKKKSIKVDFTSKKNNYRCVNFKKKMKLFIKL